MRFPFHFPVFLMCLRSLRPTFILPVGILCLSLLTACDSRREERAPEEDLAAVDTVLKDTTTLDTPSQDMSPKVLEAEIPDIPKIQAAKPAPKENSRKGALNELDIEKGASLLAASDCASCHMTDEAYIGPSLRDIAARYTAEAKNIRYLALKIREGGAGVWGDVPMTPHPDLDEIEAAAIASYILSLRQP